MKILNLPAIPAKDSPSTACVAGGLLSMNTSGRKALAPQLLYPEPWILECRLASENRKPKCWTRQNLSGVRVLASGYKAPGECRKGTYLVNGSNINDVIGAFASENL